MRDNFGLELSLAYDDCAAASSAQSRCLVETHPNISRKAALEVAKVGEIQYNRERLRQGLLWIRRNPQRAIGLTAARIGAFWFPGEAIAVSCLTVLAFGGLLLAGTSPSFLPLVFSMCVYPLPYYVASAELRRREPVMWITALLAGYLIARLITMVQKRFAWGTGSEMAPGQRRSAAAGNRIVCEAAPHPGLLAYGNASK
ncbi:MAG: hypothetical protein ACM3S5_17610 [Rhodospirillales bacterium]